MRALHFVQDVSRGLVRAPFSVCAQIPVSRNLLYRLIKQFVLQTRVYPIATNPSISLSPSLSLSLSLSPTQTPSPPIRKFGERRRRRSPDVLTGVPRTKDPPPPPGTPEGHRHRPTVGSYGEAFSCERGTPVNGLRLRMSGAVGSN